MTKLMILKHKAGGQISFALLEGKEEVASASQIEDLAETIVGEYPEAAKEIIDVQRKRGKGLNNLTFDDDITFFEQRDLFSSVEELFVDEYSYVDMDSE